MIDIIFLIFSSVFLYVCGYSLLNFFSENRTSSFFEKIGYSYGLGFIGLVLTLFALSIFQIKWSGIAIIIPWVAIWLISYRVNPIFKKIKYKKIEYSRIKVCLFILIVAAVLYVLFEALIRPVSAWDAWANWYFAGKAFFILKSMSPQVYHYANIDVPPAIPLLISYIYMMLGKQNDTLSLFNMYLFYISIILLFYTELKKHSTVFFSLLLTFLFATLPVVIRHGGRFDVGNADLPLSYIFFASVLLFNKYFKKMTVQILLLVEIFAGIGVLVKNEGVTFFLILQVILLSVTIWKKKLSKKIILTYFVGFIPFIIWLIYKRFYHVILIYLVSDTPHFSRTPTIISLIFEEFLNIQHWNFLWPTFFLVFFYVVIKTKLKKMLFLLPAIFQFVVYFYIYIITSGDHSYIIQIHGTVDRLLLHLVPIIMLWMSIQVYNFLPGFSKLKISIIGKKLPYKISYKLSSIYNKELNK